MTMKRAIIATVLALSASSAWAQSSPNWSYGFVPTAGQINGAFASKQDILGFVPLNRAGGTMLGRLTTAPPTVNGSGFNLPPGTTPGLPNNGDVWTTTAGLFARINSSTIGPFASTGSFLVIGNALSELAAAGLQAAALASLGGAPLASPALTGTPTAPTAAAGTSTTQLATTAFDAAAVSAALATAANANNLTGGTVAAARMPAFSGDIATVVGSTIATLATSGVTAGSYVLPTVAFDAKGRATTASQGALTGDVTTTAGSLATTISPGAVGNAKLAQMPAGTIKANTGGAPANAADATPSTVLDAAFGTAQGSVLYRGAAAWTALTPGTAGQYLATGGAGANAGWATPAGAGNVSTSGTPVAGQLAQFVNGTAVQGDTPIQGLTALGLNNAGQAGFRNRLINGGFAINQRAQASGTALAAAAYGHDRWKAGSGGLTYTFTQAYPATTITITAGSAVQVVEAANVEGGSYTLSWTGTTTCRVYQTGTPPALAASPIVVTGFTANTAILVECGSGQTQTLGTVQLEPGTTASAFEARPYAAELALAQRYFEQFTVPYLQSPTVGTMTIPYSFKVQKRVVPTVVTVTAPTYTSASNAIPNGASVDAVGLQFTASGTGGNVAGWVLSASADL